MTELRSHDELALIGRAETLARAAHAVMRRPNRAHKPCVEHLAEVASLVDGLTDPPLDWDDAKCRQYIHGAHGIARVCSSISPRLDRKFLGLLTENGLLPQ
jgi:hypothetical protein